MKISKITRFVIYITILISVIFLKLYSSNNYNFTYNIKIDSNMNDIEKYLYYKKLNLNDYAYYYVNDTYIQKSLNFGIFKLDTNSFICYSNEIKCKSNLISLFKQDLDNFNNDIKKKTQLLSDNIDKKYENLVYEDELLCNYLKASKNTKNLIDNYCNLKKKLSKLEEVEKENLLNLLQNDIQFWKFDITQISKKLIDKYKLFKDILILTLVLIFSFALIELVSKKNEKLFL